jgi:hypothetical protein
MVDMVDSSSPVAVADDVAALDASLSDADWPLIQQLWRAGVPNAGIYRMLRLRTLHRRGTPELDGFEQDPRAQFARWLVAHGRLNEGS